MSNACTAMRGVAGVVHWKQPAGVPPSQARPRKAHVQHQAQHCTAGRGGSKQTQEKAGKISPRTTITACWRCGERMQQARRSVLWKMLPKKDRHDTRSALYDLTDRTCDTATSKKVGQSRPAAVWSCQDLALPYPYVALTAHPKRDAPVRHCAYNIGMASLPGSQCISG